MNSTLSADTLVTAALWLLALALPLAMLLWMAAQWLAMRALHRRVRGIEARLAGAGPASVGSAQPAPEPGSDLDEPPPPPSFRTVPEPSPPSDNASSAPSPGEAAP